MEHEKINRIEELLAHQERQIQELSEVAVRQGGEIDMLKKHVFRLQDKIGVLEDETHASGGKSLSATEIAARDKPPHY